MKKLLLYLLKSWYGLECVKASYDVQSLTGNHPDPDKEEK